MKNDDTRLCLLLPVRPRVGADDAVAGAHSGKTGCWPVPVKTGQRRKAACELSVNDATVTKIVPNGAIRSHRFTQVLCTSSGQRSAALSAHDRSALDPCRGARRIPCEHRAIAGRPAGGAWAGHGAVDRRRGAGGEGHHRRSMLGFEATPVRRWRVAASPPAMTPLAA
jgi:hypothetical protein